jgi:small subunit ribosomal protein S6
MNMSEAKTAGEKPAEKPAEKAAEKPAEKSAEKSAEKAGEKAAAAPEPEPIKVDVPLGSRLYEVMFVVDAGHGRENQSKVMTELKELVEKSGGTWVNGDKWEERRLAYNIKKRKRGLYVLAHMVCPTQNITRLERNMQISDLVLRALVTVDQDGLSLALPSRMADDDDGGPGGRRFFGGGDRRRGGGQRERGDRPYRSRERNPQAEGRS